MLELGWSPPSRALLWLRAGAGLGLSVTAGLCSVPGFRGLSCTGPPGVFLQQKEKSEIAASAGSSKEIHIFFFLKCH